MIEYQYIVVDHFFFSKAIIHLGKYSMGGGYIYTPQSPPQFTKPDGNDDIN